jgi:Histidine kinase-, DNA gyrase B-, and HSP90-like ATPase
MPGHARSESPGSSRRASLGQARTVSRASSIRSPGTASPLTTGKPQSSSVISSGSISAHRPRPSQAIGSTRSRAPPAIGLAEPSPQQARIAGAALGQPVDLVRHRGQAEPAWSALSRRLVGQVAHHPGRLPQPARVAGQGRDQAGPGRDLVIEVRDSGPGFPPDFLPHAFERFRRPDSGRARSDGGAGLGLAIVSAIAQAHGGRAVARNQPGDGAAVALELPGAVGSRPSG